MACMVIWDNLKKILDTKDIENRESPLIKDYYLSDWFRISKDLELLFIPPIIWVENKKIEFLNGRHRTSLLSGHLDVFPMALKFPSDRRKLGCAIKRELNKEDFFLLPNLEIKGTIQLNEEGWTDNGIEIQRIVKSKVFFVPTGDNNMSIKYIISKGINQTKKINK